VKSGYIPGASVTLNQHARDSNFTDIVFNKQATPELSKVYVTASTGNVYVLGYKSREIEEVYKVHEEGVNAIATNGGFCITGGTDSVLRVWPIDFQEFFIEARHEIPVVAVEFSPAGDKAICGTSNGAVGVLDLQT
jgi:WD40 repeat protein